MVRTVLAKRYLTEMLDGLISRRSTLQIAARALCPTLRNLPELAGNVVTGVVDTLTNT